MRWTIGTSGGGGYMNYGDIWGERGEGEGYVMRCDEVDHGDI